MEEALTSIQFRKKFIDENSWINEQTVRWLVLKARDRGLVLLSASCEVSRTFRNHPGSSWARKYENVVQH
jgi:hypothetical protein